MTGDALHRLLRLVPALHAVAAIGCSAYSDGLGSPDDAPPAESPRVAASANPARAPAVEPARAAPPAMIAGAGGPALPRDEPMPPMPIETQPPVDMPMAPSDPEDKSVYANLRVERAAYAIKFAHPMIVT